MTDTPTVLDIRHLSVSYGLGPGSVPAVVDVDLSLGRGQVLAWPEGG